jgi:hypothetical protein
MWETHADERSEASGARCNLMLAGELVFAAPLVAEKLALSWAVMRQARRAMSCTVSVVPISSSAELKLNTNFRRPWGTLGTPRCFCL